MVECEFEALDRFYSGIRGFNRYMVECESVLKIHGVLWAVVLIDTWWNVNKKISKSLKNGTAVLIDTWWNVNYKKQCSTHYNDGVLIDTWWNVNFTPHFTPLGTSPVLIDTWWNVNLFR